MSPVISVSNLKKVYNSYQKERGIMASLASLFSRSAKTITAVDDISFTISKGELVGFIGPNGAGKTTVLKCLTGILPADGGEISVLGSKPQDRKDAYKKRIGFVTGQKNQLFWDLPPIETFYLNRDLYEIIPERFEKNLKQLSALLKVTEITKTPTRKLSLGERMKCEIIASLLHDPEVLFLDEPTIGLDVVAQKNIQEFLHEYNLRTKATIILTSHSMQDVKKLCKRVLIINKGSIIYDGLLEEIIRQYEETKRILVTLTEEIREESLERFKDEIIEYKFPQIRFSVKRTETPVFVEKLLKNLPVEDLNVEELPLEDAIGKIFTHGIKNNL